MRLNVIAPLVLALALALALAPAVPALAQAQAPAGTAAPEVERPITDDTVTAGDVALTPLTDLNLKRDEIDPLLVQARANPYDMAGLRHCNDISAAVTQLDAVLGEDLDSVESRKHAVSPGRVAQWAVGRFIPFRGLIREVSGARAHERKVRDAIVGGMMRRAFLKGMGQQKGCRYPARPARLEEVADWREHDDAKERAEEQRKRIEKRTSKAQRRGSKKEDEPQFVSQPVVQSLQ